MASKKIKQAAQENKNLINELYTPTEQEEQVDQDEAQALMEAQETRGHKGVKMPRINAAFTPSNYDYLRVMAGIHGETITKYLNEVIARDREAHKDVYEKAKDLVNSENK